MAKQLIFSVAMAIAVSVMAIASLMVVSGSGDPEVARTVATTGDGTNAEILAVPGSEAVRADPAPDNGAGDGIQVRGHWTIEVLEPDGRFVSRTVFDNALVDGGRVISSILAKQTIPARWAVSLTGSDSTTRPCLTTSGDPTACVVSEWAVTDPLVTGNPASFGNLQLEAPITGPNANFLVLTGAVTAGRDGTVDEVITILRQCGSDNTPDDGLSCVNTGLLVFSEKALSPAVQVLENQAINVTVVFSFS